MGSRSLRRGESSALLSIVSTGYAYLVFTGVLDRYKLGMERNIAANRIDEGRKTRGMDSPPPFATTAAVKS